jgi:MFS family permease
VAPDEAGKNHHIVDTKTYTSRRVVAGYLSVSVLFTLASSVIWAINTVFLLREGGLTIFQVMIVNAVFTVGQMVFEVPTGVVADTIGRRASLLLCMGTLTVATALYVLTPAWGWGIWGFIGASALIGLGFTFETGALDAWLVDALDASGWQGPKDPVFARGQMAAGGGMLVGSLLGGVLGQIGLSWPYVVRTALLVAAGAVTALMIHDAGFTPRPLRLATFGDETRRIAREGVTFGWKSPVVRPLMWGSLAGGVFFIYAFYSWQPYVLDLLGHDYVWLLGVVTAAFSLTGIGGNMLVKRVMRTGDLRRSPTDVLVAGAIVSTVLAFAIAAIGLLFGQPGVLPAALAITLWLLFGLVFGLTSPIRMGFINDHIPSAQRATVLSLDALFADTGGTVGQPGLGWISGRFSIPVGWLIGGVFLGIVPFFYRLSGRAAEREARDAQEAGTSL